MTDIKFNLTESQKWIVALLSEEGNIKSLGTMSQDSDYIQNFFANCLMDLDPNTLSNKSKAAIENIIEVYHFLYKMAFR